MFLILYTIVLDILILLLLGFISFFFFIADRDFVHKDMKMKMKKQAKFDSYKLHWLTA